MKNLKSNLKKDDVNDFTSLLEFVMQSRVVSGSDPLVLDMYKCEQNKGDECTEVLKRVYKRAMSMVQSDMYDTAEKKNWLNVLNYIKKM